LGKDLYDVWLLRNVRPPVSLLERTTGADGAASLARTYWLRPEQPRWQGLDWDGFRAEYPMVRGTARDYLKAVEDDLVRPLFGREAPAAPERPG
jgi:hypothetical protein